MNFAWFQKRWFEFRLGHNTYLGFFLSFVNFILITYNMLLAQIVDVKTFGGLPAFVVIFGLLYVPSCIIAGYCHKIKQMKYDSGMQFEETPQITEILRRLKNIEEKLEKTTKN